jgi:hypothetical protein
MNKKIATRWIKALRSGKYKQGIYGLCEITDKGKKYCCLGVLTELYQQDCKRKKKKALSVSKIKSTDFSKGGYDTDYTGYGSTKETDDLPMAVKKWAGMRTRRGDLDATDTYCGTDLVLMNDEGFSFKKIAKVIEENYEHL